MICQSPRQLWKGLIQLTANVTQLAQMWCCEHDKARLLSCQATNQALWSRINESVSLLIHQQSTVTLQVDIHPVFCLCCQSPQLNLKACQASVIAPAGARGREQQQQNPLSWLLVSSFEVFTFAESSDWWGVFHSEISPPTIFNMTYLATSHTTIRWRWKGCRNGRFHSFLIFLEKVVDSKCQKALS